MNTQFRKYDDLPLVTLAPCIETRNDQTNVSILECIGKEMDRYLGLVAENKDKNLSEIAKMFSNSSDHSHNIQSKALRSGFLEKITFTIPGRKGPPMSVPVLTDKAKRLLGLSAERIARSGGASHRGMLNICCLSLQQKGFIVTKESNGHDILAKSKNEEITIYEIVGPFSSLNDQLEHLRKSSMKVVFVVTNRKSAEQLRRFIQSRARSEDLHRMKIEFFGSFYGDLRAATDADSKEF